MQYAGLNRHSEKVRHCLIGPGIKANEHTGQNHHTPGHCVLRLREVGHCETLQDPGKVSWDFYPLR